MNKFYDPVVEYISHIARIYGDVVFLVFCIRNRETDEILTFVTFDGYQFREFDGYQFRESPAFDGNDFFKKHEFVKYPF
jgi:hypothetical protein